MKERRRAKQIIKNLKYETEKNEPVGCRNEGAIAGAMTALDDEDED